MNFELMSNYQQLGDTQNIIQEQDKQKTVVIKDSGLKGDTQWPYKTELLTAI